jgi:uncharacterized glyoxalase superfamily protein PhnB
MSITSKPAPEGWPRISSAVFYADAAKAIDWLCRAFGFEVRLKVEDGGKIMHSQLVLGDGMIMLSDEKPDRAWRKSPAQVGGCTQALCVFVDDVDAHCERARAAGATIANEPFTSDHGEGYWVDRTYEVIDLEGHHWWFMQRIKQNG